MNNVFAILEQIGDTSSRNEKEQILKKNKDNKLLQQTLEYTYNSFKVYGIGSKAFNNNSNGGSEFNNIFELCDYLLEHNTGDDITKLKVNKFINSQPLVYRDWYRKMILKDFKIGTTEKTINKVFAGLIPVFECMLASPFEQCKKLPKEIIIESKLDGIRALYLNGKLYTRNGKILEGFNEILSQLKQFPNGLVLDGELMGENFTATQELAFRKQEDKIGVNYNVFDCLPEIEFFNGKSNYTLGYRKEKLNELFSHMDNIPNIKLVETKYCGKFDQQIINDLHKELVSEGYEGIMIKDLNSYYECKRTKTWLKKKDFDLLDLEVIDIFSGTGKYSDMLGGVVVKYKNSTVEVGSGFSDEERIRFYQNPELIVGKIIMVQSQSESISKNGSISLRFPIYKGIRFDK